MKRLHKSKIQPQRWILIMLVLSSLLYSYQYKNILFSQYILMILAIYYILSGKKYKKDIIFLTSFNTLFFISLIFLLSKEWFNIGAFISSLMNLNLVIIAFIITLNLRITKEKIGNTFKNIFYIIVVLEIIQVVFFSVNIIIPYTTQTIALSDNIYGTIVSNGGMRPRAIFGEPSWLSISLFCIFTIIIITHKMTSKNLFLYIIAQFLTKSLTGILGILGVILISYRYKGKESDKNKRIIYAMLVGGVCIGSILLIIYAKNFDTEIYLLERIKRALSGEDASTLVRFTGSLEIVRRIIGDSIIWGAGLGNEASYANYCGIFSRYIKGDAASINNFFNYFIVTFGALGTIVYIFINTVYLKGKVKILKGWNIVIYFIIFHAVVGALFITPLFWVNLGFLIKMLEYNDNKENI